MQRLLLLRRPGRPPRPPRLPQLSPQAQAPAARGLSSGVRLRRPRGMRRLELVLGKPGSGKTALVRCVYMRA